MFKKGKRGDDFYNKHYPYIYKLGSCRKILKSKYAPGKHIMSNLCR